MAQQDQINTDVAAIADALTTIANELQAEKDKLASANPAADLSGLDAVAQKAKDLAASATPAAAPAEAPAPAPDASVPADASVPTDTTTPGTNPPPVV